MKRKMMMIGCVLLLCLMLFWCGRIYSINISYNEKIDIYDVGENVDISGFEIHSVETRIFTVDEYKTYFNVDSVNVLDAKDRLLCACFSIKNTGGSMAPWGTVLELLLGGFETVTWGSSVSPFEMQNANAFEGEGLAPGDSCNIWCQTVLSRVSFSKHTWDNLDDEEFFYVPVVEPIKIMMKLEVK